MNRHWKSLTILIVLLAACAPPGWRAGAARVEITPDRPMGLSGYAGRERPAEGARTPLWTKALVLEDPSGNRAVLITADLIGIPPDVAAAVRDRLRRSLGVSRAQVIVSASHTHTGPVLEGNLPAMLDLPPDMRDAAADYTRALPERMSEAAELAAAGLRRAELRFGVGSADFAVNRRNNPEPEVPRLREAGRLKGPVDHDVPVLRVAGSGGDPIAVVFGYACHCTVLNDFQWSGDYAGYAQQALESEAPGLTSLFVAGCGADQNPLPRRTVELAIRYGRELADAVKRACSGEAMRSVGGPLSTAFGTVELSFDAVPTREDLERRSADGDAQQRRYARHLLGVLDREGRLPDRYPYPVQVWRFGTDLTWVALGGEVVVDYALRLKRELGPGPVWVSGYCNDVMGYIPSERVLKEGGYEGGGSIVYYGLPARWAPGLEDDIVGQIHKLLKGVE
jgi:hypothetical protein